MPPYQTIEVGRSGPVVTVSLNRPDVRNAFNAEMIGELTDAFRSLSSESDVRAVVLRGNGPAFSAGADVNWMRASLDLTVEGNVRDAHRMSAMFDSIDRLSKPVVGQVHGAALGGGMGLMAVCDIVIAAEGTVFGFTEAKLGIIPSVISTFVLPKIGPSWARALYLTAERFGPDLAHQVGLVHWIVPVEELETAVQQKVNEVLTSGPEAVAEGKLLIAAAADRSQEQMQVYTAERIASLRTAPEGQEGLRAFLEKRSPTWKTKR